MNRSLNRINQLVSVLLFFLSLNAYTQNLESKRFVITEIVDNSEVLHIDSLIRQLDGVELLRIDFNTQNCIGVFTAEQNYNRNFFEAMLAPLGFGVKCYTSISFDGQILSPVHPRYCRENTSPQELDPERVNGPCCSAHASTGCFNAACQNAICAGDAFCCNSSWDAICAGDAIDNANAGGACAGVSDCPGASGGSGPCCSANGTAGCEDSACETAICAIDPFCCNSQWDGFCAGAAADNANAGGACAGVSNCGGDNGPCCQAGGNGTPGCNNAACQTEVCALDGFCCTNIWDGLCATMANDNALAGGACADVSDCPPQTGGPVTAGDCTDAIDVCTDLNFAVDPNGFGAINEICVCCTSNPCANPFSTNSGCLLAGELNSTWMIINIQTGGVLEFSFGTPGGNNCYDWIMYPYDGNTCTQILNNSIAPIRCNWNLPCESFTGVGIPPPPGGNAGNFEPSLNVNAGDQFVVLFSNYSSVVTNVPLIFGGSAGVSCTPLPVELLEFSAQSDHGDVLLNWTTATEINNDFYSIKRSTDGTNYTPIAQVQGSGTTNTLHSYQHRDENVPTGQLYYQLYQQDFNGNPVQVATAAVKNRRDEWHVFPNPTTEWWQIEAPINLKYHQFEIRDVAFKSMEFRIEQNGSIVKLQLENHRAGVYLLLVRDTLGHIIYTQRIVAG